MLPNCRVDTYKIESSVTREAQRVRCTTSFEFIESRSVSTRLDGTLTGAEVVRIFHPKNAAAIEGLLAKSGISEATRRVVARDADAMDGGYRIEVVSRMPGAEVDRVAAQGRKGVVDQKNCEFYDQKTYLRQQRCYGVKSKTAVSCDRHRMNIHSYVFRSPSKEMTETDELLDRLEAFQKAWSRKKISVLSQADRKNLDFFVVTPNGNLLLDEERVSYECYCLGYFGLVGNVDITLMDALTKYRQRNEVEVAFKLMFQHLLTSTRVHSSAALDGLLMTTFVGLSILTYLHTKMNGTIPKELVRNPERTSSINSLWTIQEMLKDLRRIKLAYTKSGKPRLLNVVKRDRDLAEALGFPGLFDSAENVAKLLSGSHLAATLKK